MVGVVGTTARHPVLGLEFRALYHEHFAFVWRMLVHFGVPESELEDGVQDVFIVVHRRFAIWDPSVSPRSWLYGIARRVASDRRRANHRHRQKLEALAASSKTTPDPSSTDQHFAHGEQLRALGKILERIDPKLREVFVLADIEGMTAREIGEALGSNANTISGRLRRARAYVDRALDRLESQTPRVRDMRTQSHE